jgi:hypothetical protein
VKRFRGMRTLRLRTGLAVVAASACALGLAVPAARAARVVPWRAVEVLSPRGGGYAQLVAIACVGARPCVAAGSYSPGKTGTRLAMVAADEKGRWSRADLVKLPSNENASIQDATLASVACPSARSCVAVGYYTWGTNILQGLITTGHGTSWARGRPAVLPPGAVASQDAYLSGVSCPKAGDCVAVGGYTTKSGGEAMAETMTRGRWLRAVAIRLPANAAPANSGAHLSSVSCATVGQCVAVGAYIDKALNGMVMAAYESRGRWGRAVQVGLPADAATEPQGELYAVSCVRNVYCEAAGEYVTRDNDSAGFVETESRGRWHTAVQITSLPAGAATRAPVVELAGISCIKTACLAVGAYGNKAGGLVPMAVLGSGRTWARAISTGLPRGSAGGAAQNAALVAVTCDAADRYCFGAGDYNPATGTSQAMAAAGGM